MCSLQQDYTMTRGFPSCWSDHVASVVCEVLLFLSRIQKDHDRTPDAMRKALAYKEGLQVHQCCGAYIHCLGLLEKQSPPDQFSGMKENLDRQFESGFMDADLNFAIEQLVPPISLSSIGAFRPLLETIQQASQKAKEQKAEEFASKLREANFNSVMAKIDADLATLQARKDNSAAEAIKHAKDLKYVRDRQRPLVFFASKFFMPGNKGKFCIIFSPLNNNHMLPPAFLSPGKARNMLMSGSLNIASSFWSMKIMMVQWPTTWSSRNSSVDFQGMSSSETFDSLIPGSFLLTTLDIIQ